MTNSSSDRLDRIERILETVGTRQEAISQQQEINTRSIELLGQRVDSNASAIAANGNRIAEVDRTLAEAVGRTLRGIDALREAVEEDRVNVRERLDQNDILIAGINANLAILQQLLRERNGDTPQA